MFWIILGSIITIFCLIVFTSTYVATKNQSNWDEFVQHFEESSGPYVPEETLYSLVIKIKYFSGIFALLGILLITLGVIQILK